MTTTTSISSSAPARRRSFSATMRRAVTAVALTIGLTVAGAVTATAAHADDPFAHVTVCFNDDSDFKTFGEPWRRQAEYRLFNPYTSQWQVQTTYASPTGCTRFDVHPGYWAHFAVYEDWGSYYYSASAPVDQYVGGGEYQLGYFDVTRTYVY